MHYQPTFAADRQAPGRRHSSRCRRIEHRVATATLNFITLGPITLTATSVGDGYYRSSGVSIGNRVQIYGNSWDDQVLAGDYNARGNFTGYATLNGALALCQAAATTTGTPRLDDSCWSVKGGLKAPSTVTRARLEGSWRSHESRRRYPFPCTPLPNDRCEHRQQFCCCGSRPDARPTRANYMRILQTWVNE